MAQSLPVSVIRYGVDTPLPERRLLRAGALTAVLEQGDLRYISVGNEELVRRIYVAVRDRNWGTIPARYSNYEVEQDEDSFVVRFTAEHVNDEVDFAWEGRLTGFADGVITFELRGGARRSFWKNRIGFCVLHPMALAGREVRVQTEGGKVDGRFPELISPHQPFVDMTAISYDGDDGKLTISFTGDLFEMEDQRNWTDASYKTYSTPLRLPFPVEIEEGDQVEQTVTLRWGGSQPDVGNTSSEDQPDIRIGREAAGSLPPRGLAVASHGVMPEPIHLARLRALNLGHLRLGLNLTQDDWRQRFDYGARLAAELELPLELELIAAEKGGELADLAAALRDRKLAVARILVFPESGVVTRRAVLQRVRPALASLGDGVPIGGGSRAYFTEFNRATLPLELMDVVGYGFNPQVHAFDNASLVESLAAQPVTVRSARALVGQRPVAVGPITLRPRFNPNATGPEGSDPNQLPPSVDRRQMSLFAAGWLIGSLRRLAEAGPESVTYFETTGWRGLIERTDGQHRDDLFPWLPGACFPVYHVLADAGQLNNPELVAVTVWEPLRYDVLAMRHRERGLAKLRVLVASFSDAAQTVRIALPSLRDVTVRFLDETSAELAMFDLNAFRQRVDRRLGQVENDLQIPLRPFGIATIDGVLADS